MSRRVLFVVLLLFSLGCNLSTALSPGGSKNGSANTTSTFTATINEIKGTVQARQPDQSDYANASDGLTLQLHGLVKTSNDGRARLNLSSGTIVRVAPASLFTLTDNQAQSDNSLATKLKLELGKVWIVLKGGTLDIETPAGQAGVRGSLLSVTVDPNNIGVYVTCLEGHCSVSNPAGQLDLTDGQTGRLLPPINDTYTAPQLGAMTPDDFKDWQDNVPEAAALIPVVSATLIAASTATPVNVPCVITLSGAISKTLSCTTEFAYASANGTTGLHIVSDSQTTTVAALPEAQFIAQLSGALQPGTYTTGEQAASVIESMTNAWVSDTQNGSGSSSITFTSIDVESTSAQGTIYLVHGTVTATLTAQGTASGTVVMTITF